MGSRSAAEINQQRHAHQHQQRHVRPHAARILQPLADVQPDDVQQHSHQQQGNRNQQQKCPVLRKRPAFFPNHVCAHRSARQQQPRKIKHGVNPVRPPGNEPMKISKRFLGPHIQAALFRKTRRQLVDDKCPGHEKEQRGDHPKADGRSSIVTSGGDPARA